MNSKFDMILTNGIIFTSNKTNEIVNTLGIKEGTIHFCGDKKLIESDIATCKKVIDLNNQFVMPGLIDSHMHPFWGAKQLSENSLDYQSFSDDEIVAHIQGMLDADTTSSDDEWMIVRAWLAIGGAFIDKFSLDKLKTKRPVVLFSNDCHYLALNTRGLNEVHLLNNSVPPVSKDGVIVLDEHNKPTGLIEDGAAMDFFDQITAKNVPEGIKIFEKAQAALNAEGVTTIMDARALDEEFAIFKQMAIENKLTLRILGAYEVKQPDLSPLSNFDNWLKRYNEFAEKYNTEWIASKPSTCVHQSKFFIDGMIPSYTACLRENYFENKDGKIQQTNIPGRSYFNQEELDHAFLVCAQNNIDIHCHTIADGAIDLALNSIEKIRQLGFHENRTALAHCDVTAPDQQARFKQLNTSANLSFQWSGYPEDVINLHRDLIGEEQIETKFEPYGRFFDKGVNVAYNSDWPIDPLNEWHNFQVGLTRRIDENNPRLMSDRDLTVLEVLTAATINAAYALKKEKEIGSLEVGKFADFILLDKNPFEVAKDKFGTIKVKQTWLGGKCVYIRK